MEQHLPPSRVQYSALAVFGVQSGPGTAGPRFSVCLALLAVLVPLVSGAPLLDDCRPLGYTANSTSLGYFIYWFLSS